MHGNERQDAMRYQLYCRDQNGSFAASVSVLGRPSTGSSGTEYVSFIRNGRTVTGYLKHSRNELNDHDLEYVLSQIGRILSVPMAEVVRAYEDPHLSIPHSMISLSAASKTNEEFICFRDMQNELFRDLMSGMIPMTPWLQEWIRIKKRHGKDPSDIQDVNTASTEECAACFQYPFEIASRWTDKHHLKLDCFDAAVLKMVMFDILVGHTGRTPGNYGLLIDWDLGTAKPAPLFDNANFSNLYLSEHVNGFNHLFIDRYVFAEAAYQRWSLDFLRNAAVLLTREAAIYSILHDSKDSVPNEKLCFLKRRMMDSFAILKSIVKSRSQRAAALIMPIGDTVLLQSKIKTILGQKGIFPIKIEQLGEFSWEPKYHVITADQHYFVKLSLYDRFSPEILRLMTEAQAEISTLSIPCISRNDPSVNRQINVYKWIEGVELKQVIRSKSITECYQIGIRCGQLLRTVHHAAATQIPDTYCIDTQLDKCFEILSQRNDLLIHRNIYLPIIQKDRSLLHRPHRSTLVHMDFVPKNILLSDNSLHIIDWDSCVITDPWLDFFDKGLALYPEKQSLYAGLIDGYFSGNVPSDFWRYFKALSVFALLQSAIWAINRNDTAYVSQMELHLCNSYGNFEQDIPNWYALVKEGQ